MCSGIARGKDRSHIRLCCCPCWPCKYFRRLLQRQLTHLLLALMMPLFATMQLQHFTRLHCLLPHVMLILTLLPPKLPHSIPQPQQLTTIRQLLPQPLLPPIRQAREQSHLQNTWYLSSRQCFPRKEAGRNSPSLPHNCPSKSISWWSYQWEWLLAGQCQAHR